MLGKIIFSDRGMAASIPLVLSVGLFTACSQAEQASPAPAEQASAVQAAQAQVADATNVTAGGVDTETLRKAVSEDLERAVDGVPTEIEVPAEAAAAMQAAANQAEATEPDETDAAPSSPEDGSESADGGFELGDVEAGKRGFVVCQACHSTAPGQNRLGPSLAGIVGRTSGSITGFNYSDAVAAADIVWTPTNLNAYLEDSSAVIPGNRMSQLFRGGVPDEQKRRDIIAYLATQ